MQITNMTCSPFKAKPPLIAQVQLAEPCKILASVPGLALKSVDERNDRYLLNFSYSEDALGAPYGQGDTTCAAVRLCSIPHAILTTSRVSLTLYVCLKQYHEGSWQT